MYLYMYIHIYDSVQGSTHPWHNVSHFCPDCSSKLCSSESVRRAWLVDAGELERLEAQLTPLAPLFVPCVCGCEVNTCMRSVTKQLG